MRTSLKLELQEQSRWRLRPQYSHWTIFQQLVTNEFIPPEEHYRNQLQSLIKVIGFAATHVPYYRNLFNELNILVTDIKELEDMCKVPILEPRLLVEQEKEFQSEHLPRGEKIIGYTASSGTTGRPKRVINTLRNGMMFHMLAARNYRIARFNPTGKLARITWSAELPKLADNSLNPDHHTQYFEHWRYGSNFFYTGEEIAFNLTNPVQDQLAWLEKHRPDNLIGFSGTIEHLAFASQDNWNVPNLKSVMAISEQMTPSMRSLIEKNMKIPIHENYGFNEIGIVAFRCSAGRYHVNTEHCFVEIVNLEGQHCKHEEQGRIVVTAFNNLAMPLIRYDVDDLATALHDECPCGRTSPGFGNLIGRFRRYHSLPENTMHYFEKLYGAITELPTELSQPLKQYQLHQFKDNSFELRIIQTGELSPDFQQRIYHQWRSFTQDSVKLTIIDVDEIPRRPSGKFDYFTSEFFPEYADS